MSKGLFFGGFFLVATLAMGLMVFDSGVESAEPVNLTIEQQNEALSTVVFLLEDDLGKEVALFLSSSEVIVAWLRPGKECSVMLDGNERQGISLRIRTVGGNEWTTLYEFTSLDYGAFIRVNIIAGPAAKVSFSSQY